MSNSGMQNLVTKMRQVFSVALMCACLLLLTGANFIVYPSQVLTSAEQRDREQKAPPTPTEEKSSETKAPTSIQEEYLHDHAGVHLKWINNVALHKIDAAEKLPFAPTRKVYCPPKYC